MSLQATVAVWKHADAKGSELLLLLALADYARDDGTGAFPSVQTLANKSRLSVRAVQGTLRKLASRGQIVIHDGGGRGHSNRYDLTIVGIEGHAEPAFGSPERVQSLRGNARKGAKNTVKTLHPLDQKGEKIAPISPERVQNRALKGAKFAPDPIKIQDNVSLFVADEIFDEPEIADQPAPPSNPTATPAKKVPKEGTLFPDDFTLTPERRAWTEAQVPGIDAVREFARFVARNQSKAQRYVSWDAAWRTWVLSPYPKTMLAPVREATPPPAPGAPRRPMVNTEYMDNGRPRGKTHSYIPSNGVWD